MWCSRSLLYTRVIPNFHYRHPELVSGSLPQIHHPLNNQEVPFRSNQITNKKNPHTRSLKKSPIFHPRTNSPPIAPGRAFRSNSKNRPFAPRPPNFPHFPYNPSPNRPFTKKTAENKCIHIHSQRFSHIYHIKIKHNYSYFVAVTRQITVHIARITTTQHSYLRTY